MSPATLPPVNGLLLAGGKSRRMGTDKAALDIASDGRSQVRRAFEVLSPLCAATYLSLRDGQPAPDGAPSPTELPVIRDHYSDAGPLAGILSAMRHDHADAWLVIACDLPLLNTATIRHLLDARAGQSTPAPFIAYASDYDGLPEPLCAIYEPAAVELLLANYHKQRLCPRHILKDAGCPLVDLPAGHERALDNVNTPDDLAAARQHLS